jgi:SAM-dependent methyltransferase
LELARHHELGPREESVDLVRSINAAARATGAAGSIEQFDNLGTQGQYRSAYEAARKYIRGGDHVLDWGCGNGHFSVALAQLGAHVTGFSFEPRPAALAASANFHFVAGSETEPRLLPFAEGTFDAVAGIGVLEHVWETGGDEAASLTELARVLRPGGILLTFHFPNQGGWIERVVKALRLNKHFHRRKYDEPTIRRLWNGAGFEVLELARYNALPRSELRKLPSSIKRSGAFVASYDLIDGVIARIAPSICTNFSIVARRSRQEG